MSEAAQAIIQALDGKLSQIQETVDEITDLREQLKASLPPVPERYWLARVGPIDVRPTEARNAVPPIC